MQMQLVCRVVPSLVPLPLRLAEGVKVVTCLIVLVHHRERRVESDELSIILAAT